jgi:hypothetical protein
VPVTFIGAIHDVAAPLGHDRGDRRLHPVCAGQNRQRVLHTARHVVPLVAQFDRPEHE